jgi:hypothetical protein
MKITKDKTFHGYNVAVNGKQYFIEYNWEAPKHSAWYLFEGDSITGECLEARSTKRECVELIKFWNQ